MRKIISCIIGFIPFNKLRIFLYRVLMGYRISYDSKIGWGNIINCSNVNIFSGKIGHFNRIFAHSLIMNKGSEIRNYNLVKLINSLTLDEASLIISRNSIVGLYRDSNSQRDKCNLYVGRNSLLTIRHEFDCTGEIYIGENVVFGGKDTQVWTHGFDIYRNMIAGNIVIGKADGVGVYIGSRCTICQNITICDKTVVGAATCVSISINEDGFYVSNQLVRKGKIKDYSLRDKNAEEGEM